MYVYEYMYIRCRCFVYMYICICINAYVHMCVLCGGGLLPPESASGLPLQCRRASRVCPTPLGIQEGAVAALLCCIVMLLEDALCCACTVYAVLYLTVRAALFCMGLFMDAHVSSYDLCVHMMFAFPLYVGSHGVCVFLVDTREPTYLHVGSCLLGFGWRRCFVSKKVCAQINQWWRGLHVLF